MNIEQFKKIPSVDSLLNHPNLKQFEDAPGSRLLRYCIRQVLEQIRLEAKNGKQVPPETKIIQIIEKKYHSIVSNSFTGVINATGIILHTNLGRAPLGEFMLEQIKSIILGYSNLEFNLLTGKRGRRTDHILEKLKYICGCEDAAIVNNNAAAVSIVMRTLVENKEVIVSRGELIEIGDSFRLPDIMAASGVKIVEVGTTNRTKLSDYENAISNQTGMILKVHKSNYHLQGFTDDVSLEKLSILAKKFNKILVYDIGSGLLRNHQNIPDYEPNVRDSLESGADLITFSCDKLLGGPQAGIIVGKKEYISQISSNPLMRTYRVDKLTISLLNSVLENYFTPESVENRMPIFRMLKREEKELKILAEKLSVSLNEVKITNKVVKDRAYCGGGSLPDYSIGSYSVKLVNPKNHKKYAEDLFHKLLLIDKPILGILRKGELYFNVFTLFEEDLKVILQGIKKVI